jgi:hypothetical protein
MKDVVDAADGSRGDARLGQIPFDELDLRQMREVFALAGDEAVDDAHALAATEKLFREMRTDEAGTAGHEILGHNGGHLSKTVAGLKSVAARR